MNSQTTKQAYNRNPTGKGGFGDHPENRSNGSWRKEDTARYKLECMMQLTRGELEDILQDTNRPAFEQSLAKAILSSKWRELNQMIDQVYGRRTTLDVDISDNKTEPIIKGFVIPVAPADFIDDNGIQMTQPEFTD